MVSTRTHTTLLSYTQRQTLCVTNKLPTLNNQIPLYLVGEKDTISNRERLLTKFNTITTPNIAIWLEKRRLPKQKTSQLQTSSIVFSPPYKSSRVAKPPDPRSLFWSTHSLTKMHLTVSPYMVSTSTHITPPSYTQRQTLFVTNELPTLNSQLKDEALCSLNHDSTQITLDQMIVDHRTIYVNTQDIKPCICHSKNKV